MSEPKKLKRMIFLYYIALWNKFVLLVNDSLLVFFSICFVR